MIAPKRRLTNHALHGREEWFKRIFRDQIAEAAGILEVVLSGIVLAALLMSIVPLVELMPGLLTDADSLEIRTFLERALDIVIGIEFIKMLAKHSPGSVLEVLLYAIARHMIVGHEDAVQNLVSVGAIALIFIIRKYFFVPSFGYKMPGGEPYHPAGFMTFVGASAMVHGKTMGVYPAAKALGCSGIAQGRSENSG